MADISLSTLENRFLKQLDSPSKVQEFLRFMARHPELPFDCQCLMYFQDPEAERFVVHKGIALHYGYPMKKPLGLYDLELVNSAPAYKNGIFYCVPKDDVLPVANPDMTLRAVFSRIGYTICADEDATSLEADREFRRIIYPRKWSDEKINDALLTFIVDYFWESFRKRTTMLSVNDEQWRRGYKRALIFMTATHLGYQKTMLPKTFFTFINSNDPLSWGNETEKKFRLSTLLTLYIEINQMIEGRHFTLYETLLFQLSKGNPFSDVIKITNPEPYDPYISYEMLIERYVDDRIEDTELETVHIYPPFRYDMA